MVLSASHIQSYCICLTVVCLSMAFPASGASQDKLPADAPHDSVSRWGFSVYANPGRMLALDSYVKRWLKHSSTFGIGAELHYMTLPSDSSDVAADYGYPTISLGVRYTFNGRVRMHRTPDPDWGLLEEVDYESRLGNTLSVYSTLARPLWRTRHWEIDYTLSVGLGYNRQCYNTTDDIDNELIGSHLLAYFGFGLHATWHFLPQWGLRAGVDFVHHSNGALNRPNKGSNSLGPSLALTYTPYYTDVVGASSPSSAPFDKTLYLKLTAGAGGKTLVEDWNLTQYHTDPSAADYRTSHFRLYSAWSAQFDVMYRYARRWASGLGVDVFYGSYYGRVAEIDRILTPSSVRHSPWSVGLAAKHEVFLGRWSAPMEIGVYLFRHMGAISKSVERPYYERVGIHYNFPSLGGLSVGINLNAHLFKADFTELSVSMPLVLKCFKAHK